MSFNDRRVQLPAHNMFRHCAAGEVMPKLPSGAIGHLTLHTASQIESQRLAAKSAASA